MSALQAIRGMNDLLPNEVPVWQLVEQALQGLLASFGYSEIRLPLLEPTELFKRSVGEATDIVEKEMYSFADRNGDFITLRPEGTACCVRACLQHGLLHNQIQRLWYYGPMFRYERPQKGRYRQFYQLGVETYGLSGPDIDAEVIALSQQFWRALGIADSLHLQINTLGSVPSRDRYRQDLIAYFTQYEASLDSDSQRRLTTNPLRILDSKNPQLQTLIAAAPKMLDYLDSEAKAHFDGLLALLDALAIRYVINPCLVRGLDYYTNTVFEWVSHDLGAQGTVLAGGRYDGLVAQLGGKPTPAVGFALGMERLVLLMQQRQVTVPAACDVYFVVLGEVMLAAQVLAQTIRQQLPTLKLVVHCGGGSAKSQFKRADKYGAKLALVLGEDEVKREVITVKLLREQTQQTIAQGQLLDHLRDFQVEQ